jgi:putative transcriptional regulator
MEDLFKADNILKPAKGRVLIAEPFLDDFYFKRSIILLTEHNQEGSVGFVINNQVNLKISELLPDFPDFDANISVGGPVSTDSVQFIHTLGKVIPGHEEIKPGLYWGGEFDVLRNLITDGLVNKQDILFFIGYSGWSPGQLKREINDNSWIVTELPAGLIMQYNKQIWQKTLQEMGEKYKAWANFPENPTFN